VGCGNAQQLADLAKPYNDILYEIADVQIRERERNDRANYGNPHDSLAAALASIRKEVSLYKKLRGALEEICAIDGDYEVSQYKVSRGEVSDFKGKASSELTQLNSYIEDMMKNPAFD
jgi:hypothetical protein